MRNESNFPMQQPAEALSASREPSLPMLPASSGAWLGSPRGLLLKDSKFVRAHTTYLQARAAQSDAMTRLVESRTALARSLAALATIADVCREEFERGRLEGRIAILELETQEALAETRLLEARRNVQRLEAHLASAHRSLAPEDIEQLLGALPELGDMPPETRQTVARLLAGRLKEKWA